MDYMGQYFETDSNYRITKDLNDIVLRSDLNDDYEKYCNENGKKYNKTKFIEYCEKKFGKALKTSGYYCYKGLCLKLDEEEKELKQVNINNEIEELKLKNKEQSEMIEKLLAKIKELEAEKTPMKNQIQSKQLTNKIKVVVSDTESDSDDDDDISAIF